MSEWELPTTVEKTSIERTGGRFLWESGVHKANIKVVYLDQAKSGAISFNIIMTNADGKELRESMWIKSGNAKGNKTYYEKDGKQFPLPGYSTANSMCIAAVGKPLPEVLANVEKKMVNIYNYEAKKEVPTERPVAVDLMSVNITVAVHQVTHDKRAQNAAGEYEPTGETRTINECKFFGNAEGKTAEEIANGADATTFDKWAENNTGIVVDRTAAAKGKKADAKPNATASSMFG